MTRLIQSMSCSYSIIMISHLNKKQLYRGQDTHCIKDEHSHHDVTYCSVKSDYENKRHQPQKVRADDAPPGSAGGFVLLKQEGVFLPTVADCLPIVGSLLGFLSIIVVFLLYNVIKRP